MNAAEIVVGEMQGHGSFQMRQFLAETVRKPSEATHRHSHGQILAFYERRADMFGVGIALSDLGYNPRDAWWGVPRIGRVELPVISKHFRYLREMYFRPKAFRNGFPIVMKSIGRDLCVAFDPVVKIIKKFARVSLKALADKVRGNQLRFRVNRHIHPLTTKLGRISPANIAVLFAHEGPDFIQLQIPGLQSADLGVHESRRALSGQDEQSHNRVAVQSRKPFGAADRASLKQAMQGADGSFWARGKRVPCQLGVGFREPIFAGSAFPALNTALTEGTSLYAGGVLASDAGHGFSPLDFSAELSHNEFGSGLWLTPRFGLALPTADTGDRAVSCYSTNWWRSGHGLLPRFSRRAASLERLRGSYLGPKSFLPRNPLTESQTTFEVEGRVIGSLPCLPSLLKGFRCESLLHQSTQECIYRGERILMLRKATSEFAQFFSNVARRKRFFRRSENPPNVVGQTGIYSLSKPCIGKFLEIFILPVVLRNKGGKRVHRLAKGENSCFDLLLLFEQFFQFASRLLVRFPIGFVVHDNKYLSKELSKCQE